MINKYKRGSKNIMIAIITFSLGLIFGVAIASLCSTAKNYDEKMNLYKIQQDGDKNSISDR